MKLDKMRFARVIAHCVSSGMAAGEYEVNTLDELIDIEVEAVQINNSQLESLMQEMANGARKIEAIKCYRALTGMSLKESKDAVEKYWISATEATPKKSAKELQDQMLDVLNDELSMIKSVEMKVLFRDFIRSFRVN